MPLAANQVAVYIRACLDSRYKSLLNDCEGIQLVAAMGWHDN